LATDEYLSAMDVSACKRVCADGGANRLYDELPQFLPGDDPDVVRHRWVFRFFIWQFLCFGEASILDWVMVDVSCIQDS